VVKREGGKTGMGTHRNKKTGEEIKTHTQKKPNKKKKT